MKWEKRGLIFEPDGTLSWARSYALLPTVHQIDTNVMRIYFSTLDDQQTGRVGFVDVLADNPGKIIRISEKPVLDAGNYGLFDDSGVNPSCILEIDGEIYLYYIGWQRTRQVPYMLFSGLAVYNSNNGIFEKTGRVPLLDRSDKEPFSRSAPFVIPDDTGYIMWYWSCLEWKRNDSIQFNSNHVHYTNVINQMHSDNFDKWPDYGTRCIDLEKPDEYSHGRPWVIREKSGLFRMWYSTRMLNAPYRIGYAESSDGYSWSRKDDLAGIAPSGNDWDSTAVCYPCVYDCCGRRFMIYNGNSNGRTGFGFAELVQD